MREIFDMAQKVAGNINIPRNSDGTADPSQLDMSKIFQEVTKSVSSMMTPEFIEKMNMPGNKALQIKEKKKKNSRVVVDSDEELEPAEDTLPKTKDLHFTLNVNLKHLYFGKTKNVAVKRKRFTNVNGKTQLVEDRKILPIHIKPGMHDEEVIVFEGEGDEKKGYIPGDVIVTLCYENNPTYNRMNNDLFMTHSIALSECYKLDFSFKHINGKHIGIKRNGNNIMSTNNLFKIEGYGMPIQDTEKFGNLYIRFECDIPDTLEEEQLKILETICPPLLTFDEGAEYVEFNEVAEDELDSFYYNTDEDEDEDEDEEDDYDEQYPRNSES